MESRRNDDEFGGTEDAADTAELSNLAGDRLNLLLLLLLYVMQGVTLGFSVTGLPVILESKKVVSYEDQVNANRPNGNDFS